MAISFEFPKSYKIVFSESVTLINTSKIASDQIVEISERGVNGGGEVKSVLTVLTLFFQFLSLFCCLKTSKQIELDFKTCLWSPVCKRKVAVHIEDNFGDFYRKIDFPKKHCRKHAENASLGAPTLQAVLTVLFQFFITLLLFKNL